MENNIPTAYLFDLLFDENESISFQKYIGGTTVYPVDEYSTVSRWDCQFFCINPLHPTKDLDPHKPHHSPDKPRRCDKNVIVYRNILIEMDNMSLKEQYDHMQKSGIPYSAAIFSGNKSIHFIISLTDPMTDEKSYRRLVERVYKALGGKDVVDMACKNPSRTSRFPNSTRIDTKKVQKLLEVKDRVHTNTLLSWIIGKIGPDTVPQKKSYQNYEYKMSGSKNLNGFTLNFMMQGGSEGSRNLNLFKAACDFAKCGYPIEDAEERLIPPSNLPDLEATNTIKSAYRRVENDQE